MKALKQFFAAGLLCFIYSPLLCQSCPSDYDASATVTEAMSPCGASGDPVTQGFALGTQTLTIESGATLTITGDFQVYDNVIIYGSLIVSDDMETFFEANIYVAEGGYLEVGDDYTNGGYITSGTSGVDGTMVVGGDFENRGTGTVNVGDNGSLQSGSFNNNGGTVNVSSGDTDCTTEGCCGNCGALPVVLLDFHVKEDQGQAVLNWSTAQELDNDYYIIEKMTSADSKFEEIGKVNGNGTTENTSYYSFKDSQFNQDSYYKITQVDYDGASETFGPLVLVKEQPLHQNLHLTIYPNPSSGPIQIEGAGYSGFTVYNMNGQVILNEPNRIGSEAEHIINSALENSKGTFLIKFFNEESHVIKRIRKL
jgi:hypothetical protein